MPLDQVEVARARDSWLQEQRGRLGLRAAGLGAGAAAATLALVFSPTPLLPVAALTGVLGLVGSSVIPGIELALDWRDGKREVEENGLHYLLQPLP